MEVNDAPSKYGEAVKGESIGEVKGLVEKPSTDNALQFSFYWQVCS